MREKFAVFIVLTVLFVIISGSFVFLKMQDQFVQVAKFIDSNIIAPKTEDGIPVLKEGHSAIITVDVEKLHNAKVDKITIESSFSNSVNGQFLLIDKKTINVDFGKFQKQDSDQISNGFEQMKVGSTLGPIPIMVTGVDGRVEKFSDTLNVVLYADNEEIDRISYDIIVENSGIP